MPGRGAWAFGSSAIATCRRVLIVTATMMTARAIPAMRKRNADGVVESGDIATTAGAISNATRFMTLINGLMAGPAVSLNGSPTVSPITVAAWASEPLPPWWPSSTSFLALSQAPPELAKKTAISVPAAIAPAR